MDLGAEVSEESRLSLMIRRSTRRSWTSPFRIVLVVAECVVFETKGWARRRKRENVEKEEGS